MKNLLICLFMLPLAAAAQVGNYHCVKQFAKEGIPAAQYICGVYLENGLYGAEKNVDKALLMYNEAAKQGYLEAYEALARCYWDGVGVSTDMDKINYYLKKYDKASAAMGGFEPKPVINPNEEWNGYRLESYSTDCGYADEADKVGNYVQMEYYATRAAVRGDEGAQFNLGWWYEKGDKLPRDYAKAVYWYEKAAQLGNVDCLQLLESIYRDGRPGVPRDIERADYWREEYAKYKDMLKLLENLGK